MCCLQPVDARADSRYSVSLPGLRSVVGSLDLQSTNQNVDCSAVPSSIVQGSYSCNGKSGTTASATASRTAAPTSTSTTASASAQKTSNSGMTNGAIAGIVVGAVAILTMLALLFFFLWHRRRKHEQLLRQQQLQQSASDLQSPIDPWASHDGDDEMHNEKDHQHEHQQHQERPPWRHPREAPPLPAKHERRSSLIAVKEDENMSEISHPRPLRVNMSHMASSPGTVTSREGSVRAPVSPVSMSPRLERMGSHRSGGGASMNF
jgi:hypothetical protein